MIKYSASNPSCEFTIIAGDLAYADGGPERWDSFGVMMEPLLTKLPFMTLPGNHEIEIDKVTRETFINYRKRFRMPGKHGCDIFNIYPILQP
jgi:hypothetical protein